jgi:RNA polymerase sigma factor (TIGR02999 family)
MDSAPAGEVTRLLDDVSAGRSEALSELLAYVYGELRRRAASYLRRERAGHTLQPTALVHEAWIRLVDQREVRWQNRAHFFAIAAQAMRRILVDHARSRHRAKRGSGATKVTLLEDSARTPERAIDLLALDEALERLARRDPQLARVVELRFFGGLSVEETAEVLGCSASTVKRDWATARAWLHQELGQEGR